MATFTNAVLIYSSGLRNFYQADSFGVIEVSAYDDILLVDGNRLGTMMVPLKANNLIL